MNTYPETEKRQDTELAKLILRGALSANCVVRTLVSALLSKSENELSGAKRTGASSLPALGLDHADICKAVFALTSAGSQRNLVRMFGFSNRAKPRAAWLARPSCL